MKATEVTAGPAESNGSLLPGIWRDSLHVTCGLTACTPGSAPGPTLGNEYGKTLHFITYRCRYVLIASVSHTKPAKLAEVPFGGGDSSGLKEPALDAARVPQQLGAV